MKSVLRRYAVVSLLAVGVPAFAGTAQAVTTDGVTIPDVTLTAGSGNHVVDITIAADSPVVGSNDQLVFVIDESYVAGLSAADVGGGCDGLTCEPAGSGWRAGTIQLTVSTADAKPCSLAGGVSVCSSATLALEIWSGAAPAPPVNVAGNIVFTGSAQPTKAAAPSKAASPQSPKTESAQSTNTDPTKQATTKPSGQATSPGPSHAASTAATSSPTPATVSASAGSTAAKTPGRLTVDDVADSRPASSAPWILGGVAAVILLAAAFTGWRLVSRKRD